MLDDENRDAAVGDRAHQLQRVVDLAAVETSVHFIEEQYLRLHRQALRELESLAAGERQRRRRPVRFVGETDKREMVSSRGFGLRPIRCLAGKQRACCDVVQDRHLRKWLNNLERAREPIPRGLPRPLSRDVATCESHRP